MVSKLHPCAIGQDTNADKLRIMTGNDNSLNLTVAHNVKREEPTPDEAKDLELRRKTIVSREKFKIMMSKLFSTKSEHPAKPHLSDSADRPAD